MVGSLFPSFAAVAVVALLHSLAVPPAYSQGNLAFLLCSGANYTADGQYGPTSTVFSPNSRLCRPPQTGATTETRPSASTAPRCLRPLPVSR
ncbi:unnamed protein product [Spirodela intermedia]|uniref:Uncharacterized protein n=1 Tax=Spirodela intermedia TaxID=51605 RepID=A0A7I8IFF9_SPIIN|nr:unnamed protein product [Spirodela intermedia]CAA6656536.1 unnamed protein product [Spirodela intermedia]